MTDKVQKIREEVERLKAQLIRGACSSQIAMETRCKEEAYNEVLAILDSLQEEPVKIKKGCKYRCLGDMLNNDTGSISFFGGKIYLAPEDDTLVSEENGWRCDTSENSSNFELVEEPVSEDLEEALAREWQGYNDRGAATVDALEDNTQELAFAKGFYQGTQWGKNQAMADIQSQSMALAHECPEESVTEELEEAANKYAIEAYPDEPSIGLFGTGDYEPYVDMSGQRECAVEDFKAGTEWQKQQMKVVYVVTRCEEHSDYVEEVFLDEVKAKEYCERFEGNEDAYARHITKIEVTL